MSNEEQLITIANSDMDEFNALTNATQSAGPPNRLERVLTEGRNRIKKMKEDDDAQIGALSQYAHFDGGYLPTTTTIQELPPDCYKLMILNNGGVVFLPQKLTTDSLMRLPDSKSDEVIAEVERFWTLKAKFKEFGFSHKRGFLLWGPPGSGKTSTISIIVNDMVKAGGVVILADHPASLVKALHDFRKIEPERPLVVIWEDLDSVIEYYGESTVLSVLDGEAQVENIVFIATTNYPEKLDGRIVNRPSRFDKIVKIGMPNREARELYLKHKLGKVVSDDGVDLVKETEDFSIAHLRELIVATHCQGNGTLETLERLRKMKIVPKSTDGDSKVPFGIR